MIKEFVCPNGRMSVNGVCPIFEGGDGQIKDIIKTSTDKTLSDRLAIEAPTTDFNTTKPQINTSSKIPETDFNTTKPQINTSSKISDSNNRLNYIENISKKILPEQDEKLKELKKDREKDNFFQFDFEKPTESFNSKASDIINDNINYYNEYVENKLGISPSIQEAARFGSAAYGALTGGSIVSVVAPFAIPFIAGAALNNQAQKEQEAAINREAVRDLQGRIDAGQFGSNTPTPQDEAKTNYGGSTLSSDSIGSRGPGMSGYGGGADMGGGSPGSSGPGGSDEMGSF